MKTIRILSALAILAAAGGAYAAGASDNAWLMQTPIGGSQSAPPAPAGGNTATVDALSAAVEP